MYWKVFRIIAKVTLLMGFRANGLYPKRYGVMAWFEEFCYCQSLYSERNKSFLLHCCVTCKIFLVHLYINSNVTFNQWWSESSGTGELQVWLQPYLLLPKLCVAKEILPDIFKCRSSCFYIPLDVFYLNLIGKTKLIRIQQPCKLPTLDVSLK